MTASQPAPDPTAGRVAVVAEALAAHVAVEGTRDCLCGWKANRRTDRVMWAISDQHRAHVTAAVLAALDAAPAAPLTEAEREALGTWLRHRGVYSFGLLADIADCVERILAARAHPEQADRALAEATTRAPSIGTEPYRGKG